MHSPQGLRTMQQCGHTPRCSPVLAGAQRLLPAHRQPALRTAAKLSSGYCAPAAHSIGANISRSVTEHPRRQTRICAGSAKSGSVDYEELMRTAEKAARASEKVRLDARSCSISHMACFHAALSHSGSVYRSDCAVSSGRERSRRQGA